MKALIQGTRVAQLVEDDQEFPVHRSLKWVDARLGVTTAHNYVDGAFVAPPQPSPNDEWEDAMRATDGRMPRTMEDIIDAAVTVLGQPYLDALAVETRTRYQDKQTLRGSRSA